jgi:hypothetical protein
MMRPTGQTRTTARAHPADRGPASELVVEAWRVRHDRVDEVASR